MQSSMVSGRGFPSVSGRRKETKLATNAKPPNTRKGSGFAMSDKRTTWGAIMLPTLDIMELAPRPRFLQDNENMKTFHISHN